MSIVRRSEIVTKLTSLRQGEIIRAVEAVNLVLTRTKVLPVDVLIASVASDSLIWDEVKRLAKEAGWDVVIKSGDLNVAVFK